jgi:hypothetical protein
LGSKNKENLLRSKMNFKKLQQKKVTKIVVKQHHNGLELHKENQLKGCAA